MVLGPIVGCAFEKFYGNTVQLIDGMIGDVTTTGKPKNVNFKVVVSTIRDTRKKGENMIANTMKRIRKSVISTLANGENQTKIVSKLLQLNEEDLNCKGIALRLSNGANFVLNIIGHVFAVDKENPKLNLRQTMCFRFQRVEATASIISNHCVLIAIARK